MSSDYDYDDIEIGSGNGEIIYAVSHKNPKKNIESHEDHHSDESSSCSIEFNDKKINSSTQEQTNELESLNPKENDKEISQKVKTNTNLNEYQEPEYPEFFPKENLLYIYFEDSIHFGNFDINHQESLGLDLSSDIQQQCYYPNTYDIYTFVGFDTIEDIRNTYNNPLFRNTFIEKNQIFYFNLDENDILYFGFHSNDLYYICFQENEIQPSKIVENQPLFGFTKCVEVQRSVYRPETKELFTYVGFQSISDFQYDQKCNKQFISSLSLVLYYDNLHDHVQFTRFKEKRNLFYIYYECDPFPEISTSLNKNSHSLLLEATDVQQSFLHPETNELFTFLGFQSIKIIGLIRDLVITPEGAESLGFSEFFLYNLRVNDIEYSTFTPRFDYYYFYFEEKNQDVIFSSKKYQSLVDKFNISDIQRGYFGSSNQIYTFFGFISIDDAKEILDHKELKDIIGYDASILIYNFDDKLLKYKEFQPKGNLQYVYFKTGQLSSKSIQISPQSMGINLAVEINNCFYFPKTKDLFTFVGYNLYSEIKQSLDKNEFQSFSIVDQIKCFNFDVSLLRIQVFRPKDKLFYVYFNEICRASASTVIQPSTALVLFGVNATDIQRSFFYPNQNVIYTYIGFSSIGEVRNALQNEKFKSIPIDNEIHYYNFTEHDLKYSFQPKDKLFYIYFKESSPPSRPAIVNDRQLFGMTNAIEYQRGFSIPGSQNSLTFVGFSSLDDIKAIKKHKFQSFSLDKSFTLYNFNSGDLKYKDFIPTKGLYYIYFYNPNPSDSSRKIENRQMYGLQNAVEINVGFHYPCTKQLYTFVGFRLRLHVKQAINNHKFLNVPIGGQIHFYNCDRNHLNYEDFQPSNNLYYIYFEEHNPLQMSTKYFNQGKFGIENAREIQQSYYLTGQDTIYTFIGFSSIEEVKIALLNDNFMRYLNNTNIFYYNFEQKDLISIFEPDESLFYIYFTERNPPLFSMKITNNQLFGLTKAIEYHRNYYKPQTSESYTFIGFQSLDDIQSLIISNSFRDIVDDNHLYYYNFTSSDLEYKDFSPTKGLYYIYFYNPNPSDSSRKIENRQMYGLQNAVEINVGFHFPCTKQLFTFVGFRLRLHVKQAINNHKFLNVPIGGQYYFYNCDRNHLNYEDFQPSNNLYYIYFEEYNSPQISTKYFNQGKFGIENAREIQQSYYLTGQDTIYTFLGFSSIEEVKIALSDEIFISNTLNINIHYYNFTSEDLISTFDPNESIFYVYFIERNPPLFSMKITNNQLFGLTKAIEYHRNYYKPQTSESYTFIGFQSLDDIQSLIGSNSLKDIVYNNHLYYYNFTSSDLEYKDFIPTKGLYYIYFYNPNPSISSRKIENRQMYGLQNAVEINVGFHYPCTKQLFTFVGFRIKLHVKQAINNHKFLNVPIGGQIHFYNCDRNHLNYEDFQPSNNLYYIYFEEHNPLQMSTKYFNQGKFGIENAREIQQSYYLSGQDTIYTFLGFSSIEEVKIALLNDNFMRYLNNTNIFYYNFEQKDLISIFEPDESLFYIYFTERNPPLFSMKITNNQLFGLTKAIEYHRNYYKPQTSESYTFIGFQSLDDISSIDSSTNLMKLAIDNMIYNYNFTSNDLKYRDFIPTSGLYYIYFREKNSIDSSKTFLNRKMYGLKNAVEIDVNYHYPCTKQIFTFVGFRIQQHVKQAINNQKFLKVLVDRKYYFYNCDPDHLDYDIFQPSEGLYYIYFKDRKSPKNSTKYFNQQKYGLNNVIEIQEGYYLSRRKTLFTFLGFSSIETIKSAFSNPTFASNMNNICIHYYNFEPADILLQFKPNESLFYVYFTEIHPPLVSITVNNPRFGSVDAIEYHRNFIKPGTSKSYSFIGFQSLESIHLMETSSSLKNIYHKKVWVILILILLT